MRELSRRVSAAAGIEPETAHKAIGIFLHYMERRLAPQLRADLYEAIPGGHEAAAIAAAEEEDSGGSFAGPDGQRMDLVAQLETAGLGQDAIAVLGREILNWLEEKLGPDRATALASAVPGLNRFE